MLQDILNYSKLSIVIVLLIIITSIFSIYIKYQTRYSIYEYERILFDQVSLENEWSHLILEEYTLSNHRRIELFALKTLNMCHIDLLKENIIIYAIK
ncbi:cell division protein FtsL [Wigglesworthia glossinidia]|uniref:cell division protein FtsL n=1 Tax=Wigglesworthia glossinidia TaxID=51229 RepID=UPI0038B694D0